MNHNMLSHRFMLWKVWFFLAFVVLACILCLLTTTSAPNQFFRFSTDANAFYVAGKCWAHGYVPYVDFVETKGPALFLVYAVAYFFTPESTWGIYFLASLALCLTYYQVLRICRCFGLNDWTVFGCVGVMSVFMFDRNQFGGRAENFILPLLTWLYAEIILYLHSNRGMMVLRRLGVTIGLVTGVVLQFKWNYDVVPLFALLIIFLIMACRGECRNFMLVFAPRVFLSFVAVLMPYLVYGFLTSSLDEMLDIYFKLSYLTSVSGGEKVHEVLGGNISALVNLFNKLRFFPSQYRLLARLLLLGVAMYYMYRRFHRMGSSVKNYEYALLYLLFASAPVVCFLGPFQYYQVTASTFDCFAVVSLFVFLSNYRYASVVVFVLSFLIFFTEQRYVPQFAQNRMKNLVKDSDMRSYEVLSSQIAQVKDGRILYYDGLPYGLEIGADIMPSCPTWFRLTGSGEKYVHLSDSALDSCNADFVVVNWLSKELKARLEKLGYVKMGEYLEGLECKHTFTVWKKRSIQ